MKIYVYGKPSIGKSEWVRRVKGIELNSIPDKKLTFFEGAMLCPAFNQYGKELPALR